MNSREANTGVSYIENRVSEHGWFEVDLVFKKIYHILPSLTNWVTNCGFRPSTLFESS